MNQTCSDCGEKIPNGLAVIRSVSLERVAFHGHCWDLRNAVAPVAVPALPAQRLGGTLSERLARVSA